MLGRRPPQAFKIEGREPFLPPGEKPCSACGMGAKYEFRRAVYLYPPRRGGLFSSHGHKPVDSERDEYVKSVVLWFKPRRGA